MGIIRAYNMGTVKEVRFFIDDKEIKKKDLKNYELHSDSIDRIVDRVFKKYSSLADDNTSQ